MLDVSKTRNKKNMERPWYGPALKLIRDFPRGTKVLDIGCGLGEFSHILTKKGFAVQCADGSKTYVRRMKKKGFHAKCFDFNEKFPYQKNSFDLVVSLEVIEHVEKAEQFLSEIHRILKPGGHLLLSTPNVAYFGLRLRAMLGVPPPDEGYHFRFFTFKSLKKILMKEGFGVVKHKSITFLHGIHKVFKCNPITIPIPVLPNVLSIKSIILARKK